MRTLIVLVLRAYKRWLSPWLPPSCRFTPTCSEYAMIAFRKYSTVRATWLTVSRLFRCHPFSPGGIDLP